MSFIPDTRGLSEVLGAILVFGLVISVVSAVQVAGVPAANQQVEFEHNARVQADFQAFDGSVDRAATTGASESVAFETGVRYPPRLFLLNPGPAAGTVSTGATAPVELRNLAAVNPETGEFLDGTWSEETTTLTYTPNYNEYRAAPTTHYEHGVLYNADEDATAVFDRGNVVAGDRISLTLLAGSVSESSTRSVTMTATPLSYPAQRVAVTGDGSDIVVSLHTNLSQETWERHVLADELQSAGGNVVSVVCTTGGPADEPCDGPVEITLDGTRTYELWLSQVSVDGGDATDGPAYLTRVGPAAPAIQPGGTDVTVELRDAFNAPVAGRPVSFEITSGDAVFVGDTPATTDEDGRATITVDPVDNASISVRAFYDPDADNVLDPGEDSPEFVVTYAALPVADNARQPTGDLKDINPRNGNLRYVGAEAETKTTLTATFQNEDDTAWTIEKMRVSFVMNPDKNSDPEYVTVSRTDGGVLVTDLPLGDPLTPVANGELGPAGSTTDEVSLRFAFDDDLYSQGNAFEGMLVLTFEVRNTAGEVTYLTYFVSE
ncbi:DUF7289 family protein [Halorarius halobius]|uniref:DUF7289 family protein n=1 Tax=Halorarius halobius TaxID=2962671 RepID=UPI0020CDD5B9|nr:Ig-like domain-containing protein [Halorarius halobius]